MLHSINTRVNSADFITTEQCISSASPSLKWESRFLSCQVYKTNLFFRVSNHNSVFLAVKLFPFCLQPWGAIMPPPVRSSQLGNPHWLCFCLINSSGIFICFGVQLKLTNTGAKLKQCSINKSNEIRRASSLVVK